MPSTVTTFAVFQTLLQRSIDLDPNLDSATKAALKTRAQNLVRQSDVVLDQSMVQTLSGFVTSDSANRCLLVGVGAGPSRAEFSAVQLVVPIRIDGTKGVRGFLPGHPGTSVVALIDSADISLQYRLSSSEVWRNFDRNTVLDEVTWIQFAADFATQVGTVSVPQLHIHAEQV